MGADSDGGQAKGGASGKGGAKGDGNGAGKKTKSTSSQTARKVSLPAYFHLGFGVGSGAGLSPLWSSSDIEFLYS